LQIKFKIAGKVPVCAYQNVILRAVKHFYFCVVIDTQALIN